MASAWPQMLVLPLLVTAAAAFPTSFDTQALQCSDVQTPKASPAFFPLDERATRSLQFSFPTGLAWDASLTLGEGLADSFIPRVSLDIKKSKPSAQLAMIKVTIVEGTKALLLNSRVDSRWLEGNGEATLFYGGSALSIAFVDGDSKLLQQVSDPQLEGLSAMQVKGDLQVKDCDGPGRVPDTTVTTTPVPTTTTTTTPEPTTTTTTAAPTTTTATTTSEPTPTTTTFDEESSAFTTESTSTATASVDDNPPQPCVPVDYEVPVACPTPSNDSVNALSSSVECVAVPPWAWACAGLSVVFFLFMVGLIIYSITLYKRSWKHGKAMQLSGGYGMSAQDMHYFAMGNNNLMIGNTVPRIVTPRPTSQGASSIPSLTPRQSVSRLSHSMSSRPTTPFPQPPDTTDLENSTATALDQKEKSRSSKVSFADD